MITAPVLGAVYVRLMDAPGRPLNVPRETPKAVLDAYLLGAAHDGCVNKKHGTLRICQANLAWLRTLDDVIRLLGARAWTYREGDRGVWVIETSYRLPSLDLFASHEVAAAYARGYFDAEGGVPVDPRARFYVQFVQKDYEDLVTVRDILRMLGIEWGRLHNPSAKVDPHYWRFYVLSRSHLAFIRGVGSWHPRKSLVLELQLHERAQSGMTMIFTPRLVL